MISIPCLAKDDLNRIYHYCPSFASATCFCILFGLVTAVQIFQAFQHRKSFCWVLVMAGLWETGGYAVRCASIASQTNSALYTVQFLLILLAPLWINAYIYMVLGRMIHYFLEDDRVHKIRARRITLIFVLFDITAFVVQLLGGLMSSGAEQPIDLIKLGLRIYTIGVGLQLAFIGIFCAVAFQFCQLLRLQDTSHQYGTASDSQPGSHQLMAGALRQIESAALPTSLYCSGLRTSLHARPLLVALFVALSLVVARNVYRLVEYGLGGVNGNTITKHEWWMYVFDGALMLAAIVVFSIYHPGRVLRGERSDFKEEDKARKAEKKLKRQARREAKTKKHATGRGGAEQAAVSSSNIDADSQENLV